MATPHSTRVSGAKTVPRPLTDLVLKTAKLPQKGTLTLWDGSLTNFGVRVSAGGAKTFIVLISSGRRQKIGRYPTLSLAIARTEAKRLLAEKTLGKIRPRELAFEDARDKFLLKCKAENKPRTVADYTRLLNRHFPFKRKAVADITPHDVQRRLEKITAPMERRYAFVVGRVFFTWCFKERYIDRSPMDQMQAPALGKSRSRILTDEELKKVWVASGQMGAFGTIVKLLCLTGQRRGEIAALQREWVTKDAITLPREVTKNSQPHTFPIGALSSTIITRSRGGDLLFPARAKDVPFNGWSKSKAKLDQLSGVTDWTLHDLRRTFSSGLAGLGVPLHVTEKILNHSSGTISGVAATYNRYSFMDEMRDAMHKWENHIQSTVA